MTVLLALVTDQGRTVQELGVTLPIWVAVLLGLGVTLLLLWLAAYIWKDT